MRTDPHEHKHAASMAVRGHRHQLAEVDAAIVALAARVATLEALPHPPSKVVNVSTVVDLLSALADDVDEIVMRNGVYAVSRSSDKRPNSLWIGERFAERTRPVLARAETPGGVIFDGGGATYFGGISFEEGADHQTWQGFKFASGGANSTGIIVFGGYQGLAGAHHITLKDTTILETCTASTPLGVTKDHAVYFSGAVGGVHDILIDGLTHIAAEGALGLDSTINFGKQPSGDYINARNVIVRNMHVTGGEFGVVFWEGQGGDLTIEDSTITNALRFAVRYEETGRLTLRRVVSTDSGVQGFYSSLGANPPGVIFEECDLR